MDQFSSLHEGIGNQKTSGRTEPQKAKENVTEVIVLPLNSIFLLLHVKNELNF